MDNFMVSCKDRHGRQYSSTFDYDSAQNVSLLRRGWQESIRLCGHIAAVASAYVSTIDGKIIGTLR